MLPFERLNLTSAPLWHFCEIGWQWSPPLLTDFMLWFVQNGRGELQHNSTTVALSNGMGFIFEPGSRLIAEHSPLHPLRIFSCHFTLEKWNSVSLWTNGVQVRDNSLFVLSAQKSHFYWQQNDAIGRELARREIEQIVLRWWDAASHLAPSERDSELDELVEAIRREPARPWNLDDMAFALNLSRAQFVRLFRARFACAPMAFVVQIRLERSKQLLLESNLSLDSIARAVGFGDAPFLSKNFKSAFGTAPGAWRRLAKNSKKNSDSVIDNGNKSL